MEFIEGQRFYVTEARAEDLGRWLRGERVASRVVETHPTFAGARDEMARRNHDASGATYDLVTSDLELIRSPASKLDNGNGVGGQRQAS